MLIVRPFSDRTKRLAELLWAYESDEPHYHCDRGPGHYPAITWEQLGAYTTQPHAGDCVGLPATCVRCVVEEIINKARWLAERIDSPTIKEANEEQRESPASMEPSSRRP